MVREKVKVSTQTLQWKCVKSRTDSKCLYYGCFVLSPLMKGQADTIVIAMRRALLREIEGTCITHAKSEKIPYEYSTIVGIQESVHEILINLKEIVLRSNLYGTRDMFICVKGPGDSNSAHTKLRKSLRKATSMHLVYELENYRSTVSKLTNSNLTNSFILLTTTKRPNTYKLSKLI